MIKIEKDYSSNIKTDKTYISNININHPYIKGIYYINNGIYAYGSNDNKNGDIAPIYIKSMINKKIRSLFLIDKENKNQLNYTFKFGSGYFIINYYLDLIKQRPHNIFSNYYIYKINQQIKNPDYMLTLKHYSEHLNLNIVSGFTLKSIIGLFLITLISIVVLFEMLLIIFRMFLDSRVLFLRKIKKGAQKKEFIPYFQSIYSLKNKKFISAEILCRWNHEGEIIPPSIFITDLESMNEIKDVTLHMMVTAFKTLKKSNLDIDFSLSFNFTVTMMLDKKFISKVIKFVNEEDGVKNRLIIELTESENNFIHIGEIKKVMMILKKEGITFSIDDVGAGYSSLITIQELPFDIMKIDKCFISKRFAASDSNMLELLSNLGRAKKLKIIAEGVENIEELRKIKQVNLDLCQGFYFSKPCNAEDFLSKHKKP